jgi:hypothetical protein
MATPDHIAALTASNETKLAHELNRAVSAGLESIDAFLMGRALDDSDGDHIREQLGTILGLDDDGAPEGWTSTLAVIAPVLLSFVGGVAAHAAAQAKHVLNPQDSGLSVANAAAARVVERFKADTVLALAAAIEAAIYGPGTPESRAAQIRRSFGLTIKQAASLEHMRTVLQRYLRAPLKMVLPHVDANGVRVPASKVRKIDTRQLLAGARGHISAPQAKLLAKALADPKLTAAQADALLDRHADAARAFRLRAVAGEAIHDLAETAKLAGWRIAQRAGALPADQRRYWQTAGDERVRHTHAQVATLNRAGVRLGVPFQTPFGERDTPPLEYGCRCKAVLRPA